MLGRGRGKSDFSPSCTAESNRVILPFDGGVMDCQTNCPGFNQLELIIHFMVKLTQSIPDSCIVLHSIPCFDSIYDKKTVTYKYFAAFHVNVKHFHAKMGWMTHKFNSD